MTGCSSDPNGVPPEKYITGTMKNSRGEIVANAYLNMFYSSVVPSFPKAAKTLPSTSIAIDIPHPGFLRIDVENYIHEFIRNLIADSVDAGVQEVTWDSRDAQGRDLYSDCYWVIATLDGTPYPTKKMLLVKYQYDDPNPAPFAMTNGIGRFSIPYSRLPLKEKFVQTDYSNGGMYEIMIGPTDQIYAFTSNEYGVSSVTYSNPHELTIVLSQKK